MHAHIRRTASKKVLSASNTTYPTLKTAMMIMQFQILDESSVQYGLGGFFLSCLTCMRCVVTCGLLHARSDSSYILLVRCSTDHGAPLSGVATTVWQQDRYRRSSASGECEVWYRYSYLLTDYGTSLNVQHGDISYLFAVISQNQTLQKPPLRVQPKWHSTILSRVAPKGFTSLVWPR